MRLLLVLLCLLPAPVFAQSMAVLRGMVTDAETGEGLPSANVLIEGTRSGTITNADGAFELGVPRLPVTLAVRYVGYRTARVQVVEAGRVAIRLAPVAFELGEIEVTGENPAANIMRRVIARKEQQRAMLDTWQARAYTRFTILNDSGIVAITEGVTRAYWDRTRGMREVAEARRQTANLGLEGFMPAAATVLNFYADDVNVAGFRAIGPTHPEALKHYRFALLDQQYLDDQLVYVIGVEPRSKLQPSFRGQVSVLGGEYALLSVDLVPNAAIRYPPPISEFTHAYKQQFSDFGQDVWLPVDFRYEGRLAVRLPGLTFPGIRFQQASRLTDYDVNVPLPDSLYANERALTIDSVAVAQATALDVSGLAIPLSITEATAYEALDSTATLAKAFQPTGPLARFVNLDGESDENGGSVSVGARAGGAGLSFRLDPRVWFNRVEGLHAGGRVRFEPVGVPLTVYAEGGYQTHRKDWTYGGGASLYVGAYDDGQVAVDYTQGAAPRYASPNYTRWMNGIGTVLGFTDYFDYYQREAVSGTFGWDFAWGRAQASFTHEDARSLTNAVTAYDLLGRDAAVRPNPVLSAEGRRRSLGLGLRLGRLDSYAFAGDRLLDLHAEVAADAFGSDYAYTRLTATGIYRLTTFFPRRLFPNTLDLRAEAGTSFGTLPSLRPLTVDGTLAGYSPFGTLRARRGLPYEGEHAAALFWEHNFRTIPFEVLGLRRLAELNWALALHGAHAKTWIGDATRARWGLAPTATPTYGHHEIGLSLHGLGTLFRLDGTVRLDRPGFFISFGLARVF